MGIVIGVILIIAAIVLFVMRSSSQSRLEQLTGAAKQKLGELIPVLQETKAALSDIGDDGAIKENVTVVGQPECASPLTSPIGNVPCLYYKYRVSVRTKIRYQETDSQGNQVWRTREEEDTLDEGSAAVPSFTLRDETGSIIVEPSESDDYDGLTKSVERSERSFQNNQMFSGNQFTLGRLSIDVGDLFDMNSYDRNSYSRASGYSRGNRHYSSNVGNIMNRGGMPEVIKYVENVMTLDRRLTVVGTVCDSMGDFRLRKTAKHGLIISTKSSQELIAETESSIKSQGIGAVVCLIIAVISIIIGCI